MRYCAALWLLAAPFVRAQAPSSTPVPTSISVSAPTVTPPDFQIEIQPTAEKGPTFTVRNMSDKTITACVFQFSHSDTGRREGGMSWDAIAQRKAALEPGATLTHYLPHAVGQPLPDKIVVVAGAFADGETFGQPVWIKTILQGRAMFLAEYEQAAMFLQKGLDEHWTYEQYLAALDLPPKLSADYEIRRTLEVNINARKHAEVLQEIIEGMVDRYNRYARKIREAQAPASSAPAQ